MSDSSQDKDFYDTEIAEDSTDWAIQVRKYADNWIETVRDRFASRRDVRCLELGAGSCTTSIVLSKEAFTSSIVAADLSTIRMQEIAPQMQALFGGDIEKLTFKSTDMNEDLDFTDDSFDIVVMDAALHHSRNIWQTLAEIRRVLKPGGLFVAQREAYTSPLTNRITFKRLLASPEVAAGVSENAYLPSQYDYYLRANGFEPKFLPVYERAWQKAFFFLNGIVFSKYNIVSRSTKAA